MKYSEKLRDPRWQRKRLEVFAACGWKCCACGAETQQLHVHHRYYTGRREPWDYPRIALVSLCADCHEEHGKPEGGQGEEWETLLSQLFEPTEFYWDGISIAASLARAFEYGFTKEQCRDMIEAVLEVPEIREAAAQWAAERRARWAVKTTVGNAF